MAEPRPQRIEVLQGDVVQGDGRIARAGLIVENRRTLLSPDTAFGKGVYRDSVTNQDGTGRHNRFWTDYPEGAFMVAPTERLVGMRPEETVVFLGKNLMLYGVGRTDGVEAMGARIRIGGKDRTAEQAARELMTGKGFTIGEVSKLAVVSEITSRTNNPTDIVRTEVISAPSDHDLDDKNVMRGTLEEYDDMIDSGVITNGATITTLHHVRRWAQRQYRQESA